MPQICIICSSPVGGAVFLSNVCEQLSVGDSFLGNSAQQGGAIAILNPALNSGRYILSVMNAAGASSILRLPCGVSSALANATFIGNEAELSGGAVYAVSTPLVGAPLPSAHCESPAHCPCSGMLVYHPVHAELWRMACRLSVGLCWRAVVCSTTLLSMVELSLLGPHHASWSVPK